MRNRGLWRRNLRIARTLPQRGDPNRNLMAAVLQAAVADVREGFAPRHALAYVVSTDRGWPFSFENICETLGMDPDDVRRQLWSGLPVSRGNECDRPPSSDT